uniref:Uncharacterized protein n=1 Tax=Ditylenchus dipsaci TaxID=166011 RepID=A0A915EJI5_9BILA
MPCSVSCGIGFQLRERHCSGQICHENSKQARTCNVQDCSKIKSNALLSQWSLWGACSKTSEQVLSEQKGVCWDLVLLGKPGNHGPLALLAVSLRQKTCSQMHGSIVGVGGVEQDTEVDHTSCSGVPIEYDTCERSCLDEPENNSSLAHGVETSSGLSTPIIQ